MSIEKYVFGLSEKDFLKLSIAVDLRKHRMNLERAKRAGLYPLPKKYVDIAFKSHIKAAKAMFASYPNVSPAIIIAAVRETTRETRNVNSNLY